MACSDKGGVSASDVARLCIAKFNALPKNGKPVNNEWTVLAGIIQCDRRNIVESGSALSSVAAEQRRDAGGSVLSSVGAQQRRDAGGGESTCSLTIDDEQSYSGGTSGDDGRSIMLPCGKSKNGGSQSNESVERVETVHFPPAYRDKILNQSDTSKNCFLLSAVDMKVVALGTGSKCLGTSKWCPKGTLVHDGHAEVVAKRSFQLYLIDQAEAAYLGKESVFRLASKTGQVLTQPVKQKSAGVSSPVRDDARVGRGHCYSSEEYISAESCDNFLLATNKNELKIQKDDLSYKSDEDCSVSKKVSFSEAVLPNLSDGNNRISTRTDQKLVMAKGVSFHLYISHTPCGDCSIFPKEGVDDENSGHGDLVVGRSRDSVVGVPPDSEGVEIVRPLKEKVEISSVTGDVNTCSNLKMNSEVADLGIMVDKGNLSGFERLRNEEIHSCEDTEDVVVSEPCLKKFKPAAVHQLAGSKKVPSTLNLFDLLGHTNGHPIVSVAPTDLPGQPLTTKRSSERGNVKCSTDIHRTGAKCVSGETEDLHLPGRLYHNTGALRTKPGRGDPTLSHCCSDKLVKWTVLGLQGSLLAAFCETPVYLDSLVIGSCPFSREAMERGLFLRFKDPIVKYHSSSNMFKLSQVNVLKCDIPFEYSRTETQRRLGATSVNACPSSISWHPGYGEFKSQVIVNGRKLGVTKKALGTVKSQVPLCRYQVMAKILKLHGIRHQNSRDVVSSPRFQPNNVLQQSSEPVHNDHEQDYSNISYRELKGRSVAYREAWDLLRKTVLTNWTLKPVMLQDFVL